MKLVRTVVVLSAILIIGGGAMLGIDSAAAQALKLAHVYETSHPLHEGALEAARLLEERTGGRITMEVFPASSLGKEADLNEALSLGTIDVIYTGAGFAENIYGPIAISDYPFTLRNLKHWDAYRNSDLFAELSEGYTGASGGNEILAVSYYGSRHVTSNKPILRPADMAGLKIRVPNAPSYVLFPETVGANPTPIAFAEVYLSLQQGVVDAQENPLTTIQAKKFHEVQSNINLTGHITNSIFTIASGVTLARMSDEDKEILTGVLAETADWITDQIVDGENSLVEWFRGEGITVNEVDRAPFIEAVAPALVAGDLPFGEDVYRRLQAIPDAR
ncbi:MAG: sialic acid TRAP transporter substrate-binding protein SiaP [Alphaproteobacteria bacterium]|nr:sialic acid TRAP transporter substrate-binding protein SiaP [Alphaproteobacteria bacterium]MDA8009648.1 sialic acid TRAP transporter substrate-binding protein SiaP [Alphaproteobacteria bacterium]